MQYLLACQLPFVEIEIGQSTGNCMPCHLSEKMLYPYS